MTTTLPVPLEQKTSVLLTPVVLLAVFVLPISIAGTGIAIPAISKDLGDSPAGLQWVVNGFNFSVTVFTVVWGAVAGRLGYRQTFLAGLAVMIIASGLSASAGNLLILDIARVLAGVGAGALVTGGTALISQAYSGVKRAKAFAFLGTTVGLGLAAGPTISGALVGAVGWRGIFAVVGAISLVVLVVAATRVVPRTGSGSTASSGKLLDFTPLKNRAFMSIVLVPVAGSIGYVSILTYLPVALSAVANLDIASIGLFMLPLTLPVLVGPMLTAALIHRVPRITSATIIFTSLGMLITGDLLLLLLSPSIPLGALVAPMLLLGFGWGLPLGLIDGEALAAVPAESAGAAAGLLNFLRLGSEAVSVAAYGAVLTLLLTATTGDPVLARSVAAGGPGGADAYVSAFHILVGALALTTAVLSAGIAIVHRSHIRRTGSPSVNSAESRQA